MAWPYEFQNLSDEERAARRLVLDRYGHYSLLLVLVPVAGALCLRAGAAAVRQVRRLPLFSRRGVPGDSAGGDAGAYHMIPPSPSRKAQRDTLPGRWAVWGRQARWWLSEDVVLWRQTYGQRDQWVVGAVWMAALLLLCVLETGRDYLHLTKRLGTVAVAQFPLQYVLALKRANPVAWALASSHEQVNRWHRVLGVLAYSLLLAHTALYLNFFYHDGGILPRLRRPVIVLGLLGITAMTLLSATSLALVRRLSYRLFFLTHVAVVMTLPALIFFHADAARPYLAASLALLLADVTLRRLGTATVQATVTPLPGSADLVRLAVPLPPHKLAAFGRRPAAHLYLSLPWASRGRGGAGSGGVAAWWRYLLFEFVLNPFTVAAVDERAGDLTLVVRTRRGPLTTVLARAAGEQQAGVEAEADESDNDDDNDDDETAPAFASSSATSSSQHAAAAAAAAAGATLAVGIEGPYGLATLLDALAPRHADRVLLVAGGVGATFAVPLYRALVRARPGRTVDLVWAVRGVGDARWAAAVNSDSGDSGNSDDSGSSDSLLADPNVHIFLTGGADGQQPPGWLQGGHFRRPSAEATEAWQGSEEGVELAPVGGSAAAAAHTTAASTGRARPDLRQIVDDVFRHGSEERVAVVVCGPASMVQDLRAGVAPWVQRGRSVWWHNETFGW